MSGVLVDERALAQLTAEFSITKQQLDETRQAWNDCREEFTELRRELAEARAALRDAYQECATICVEVAEDIPRDASVWWTAAAQKCCDRIERQAAALKAGNEEAKS